MIRCPKKYYTPAQREWCRHYQRVTTFEPLMDGYEYGEETFGEAMRRSLDWFEDWSRDAFHHADRHTVPDADAERRLPIKAVHIDMRVKARKDAPRERT